MRVIKNLKLGNLVAGVDMRYPCTNDTMCGEHNCHLEDVSAAGAEMQQSRMQ